MTRRAVILLGILIALFVVYTFHWFNVKSEVEARYAAWSKDQLAAGATIDAEMKIDGYPFAVTMHTDKFKYERPDAFRIQVPDLSVTINPLTPFRVTAKSDNNAKFFFYKANYTFTTQSLMLSIARPLFKPNNSNDNGLFVQLHVAALGLDENHKVALGNLIQELSFKAKLKGEAPKFDDKASIEDWRNKGGNVELDRVFLNWGSLIVNAKGNLTLDKNFQPAATFSSSVSGYDQAIDVLREQNQVQPIVASVIKAALKLLEDPKAEGQKTIKVPVMIKNSTLSIAGVDITSWDPYPVP